MLRRAAPLCFWRRSQAVRQRPAKPLFPGSNPGGASRKTRAPGGFPQEPFRSLGRFLGRFYSEAVLEKRFVEGDVGEGESKQLADLRRRVSSPTHSDLPPDSCDQSRILTSTLVSFQGVTSFSFRAHVTPRVTQTP